MSLNIARSIFVIIIITENLIAPQLAERILHENAQGATYKHRCTRRYSPGVCLDTVSSVWTFEFQIMNCTERLGCSQSSRTNRFRSYDSCLRICQPIIDLYMQILSYNMENDSSLILREKTGKDIRREGSVEFSIEPEIDPKDLEYAGDESVMTRVLYGDGDAPGDGDNGRTDVDYVREVRDPDDYFSFH